MHFIHHSKYRKVNTRFAALLFVVLIFILGSRYLDKTCFKINKSIANSSSQQIVYKKESVNAVNTTIRKNSAKRLSREEIFEKTRSKISTELQHYNFSYSGVNELKDLVMESGGNPLRSVIVSTWRSGSSFLGELLNVMPGNFYNYEPFVHHRFQQIRGSPHAEKDIKMLKSLLNCNYRNEDVRVYFQFKKINNRHFKRNTRLMEYCKNDIELCHDADFTENMCKLFPFLTIKLVLLRLRILQDIMKENRMNVRMVLLIRDPRAVMASRSNFPGCSTTDCADPKSLCSDMVNDYEVATKLLRQYPTRFTILRYEDLALNPSYKTHKLYDFLQLGVPLSLDTYINTHTNSGIECGIYCTYRKSSSHAFKWKYVMDFEHVNKIQTSCKEAMMLWGYRNADNATQLKSNEFYPLEKSLDIKIL